MRAYLLATAFANFEIGKHCLLNTEEVLLCVLIRIPNYALALRTLRYVVKLLPIDVE